MRSESQLYQQPGIWLGRLSRLWPSRGWGVHFPCRPSGWKEEWRGDDHMERPGNKSGLPWLTICLGFTQQIFVECFLSAKHCLSTLWIKTHLTLNEPMKKVGFTSFGELARVTQFMNSCSGISTRSSCLDTWVWPRQAAGSQKAGATPVCLISSEAKFFISSYDKTHLRSTQRDKWPQKRQSILSVFFFGPKSPVITFEWMSWSRAGLWCTKAAEFRLMLNVFLSLQQC